MRKVEIAEAILSLGADRERAAAIAGDLLEESRGSALRFWWLVAQTSLLRTGRQLSAAPFGMLGAAARALLIELGVLLLFSTLPTTVGMINVVRPWLLPNGFVMTYGLLVAMVVVVPSLGESIARRYPGREGTVIVNWVVLRSILCMSIPLWDTHAKGFPLHSTMSIQALAGLHWFLYCAISSFIGISSGVWIQRYKRRRGIARA